MALQLVVVMVVFATMSFAQVTSSSLEIGGLGALGCATPVFDPPTLEGGVPGGGLMDFSYDNTTQILTLVVTNTSEVTPGVPNPVIREIYFNVPFFAVQGLSLLTQTGSGGATPAFNLEFLPDAAGCFGTFSVALKLPSAVGGIANADADTLPPGAMVTGPVTFTMFVDTSTPAAAQSLTAEAFAHTWSVLDANTQAIVNAMMRFSGGGPQYFGGGFLSNAPGGDGGAPAGYVVGIPEVAERLTFILCGTPGWFGCMILSDSPGPTQFGDILLPIGPNFFVLTCAEIPAAGNVQVSLFVPAIQAPELGQLTFYGVVGVRSPEQKTISVSERFAVGIDFG